MDDNNRLWVIYSDDQTIYPDGGVLGFVNSNKGVLGNNGEFSVSGKNYSYEAKSALDITITGDYKISNILKGEVSGLLATYSTIYTLNYDKVLSNRKQNLASINNNIFNGIAYITGDDEESDLKIRFSSNGNFIGKDDYGCKMTGKLTLSVSQRYFDSIVKFGEFPCYASNETLSGVGLLDEDGELIIIGTDKSTSKGVFFSSAD